ncbi:MAG: hypothetical protein HZB26_02345 [Candidatus Hydrogenedentes bacterium]|nr:hypothetical protein [Candidatus Hydrogenedentota bacterium]
MKFMSCCRVLCLGLIASLSCAAAFAAETSSAKIGVYPQEIRTTYTIQNGLPDTQVSSVVIGADGAVYAGTAKGLARFAGGTWSAVQAVPAQPIDALTVDGARILLIAAHTLHGWDGAKLERIAPLPGAANTEDAPYALAVQDGKIWLGTRAGLYSLTGGRFQPETAALPLLASGPAVRQIAVGPKGELVVAAQAGLLLCRAPGKWEALHPATEARFVEVGKDAMWDKVVKLPDNTDRRFPMTEPRSWAPKDVRGVTFDSLGRLWFASPQGVGCYDGKSWSLYTGKEGLPYNDFTCLAPGEGGAVWFGTQIGAIKYDGTTWEYRQGERWLADDSVRGLAVTKEGNAWFATAKGASVIERKPMTLAGKAKFFEDQIDKYHRRTEYGYITVANLDKPGDLSVIHQQDDDNDGLWTAMYGAGECFAYGATKDPKAKERAKKAFEALRFLGTVTQGGKPSPPKGYVARSVLPTSGPDPNKGRIEGDIQQRANSDTLWKVYEWRWPISKDGKWYWKSDTSSDELDGHFFFYPLYYDLVCETNEEKEALRTYFKTLADHLVNHNFDLVDHDGTPTRWGYYDPEHMNHDVNWFEDRGLKCLSILSYLTAAEHVTGDAKYTKAIKKLRDKHGFDINAMFTKVQRGIGSGNQSDDEMAFMCFYNLIKYTKDPQLRMMIQNSLFTRWVLEAPEMNPFFNFICAASCSGAQFKDAWGLKNISPWDGWLEDSMDTLMRFPVDRFNWRHTNSHRLDIVPLPRQADDPTESRHDPKGVRTNGKVLPIDECIFNHWNRDPYEMNTGGNGAELADGTVFTLPYYMGLYHGYIVEKQ